MNNTNIDTSEFEASFWSYIVEGDDGPREGMAVGLKDVPAGLLIEMEAHDVAAIVSGGVRVVMTDDNPPKPMLKLRKGHPAREILLKLKKAKENDAAQAFLATIKKYLVWAFEHGGDEMNVHLWNPTK